MVATEAPLEAVKTSPSGELLGLLMAREIDIDLSPTGFVPESLLQLVGDRPMLYYPLHFLLSMGIRTIGIVADVATLDTIYPWQQYFSAEGVTISPILRRGIDSLAVDLREAYGFLNDSRFVAIGTNQIVHPYNWGPIAQVIKEWDLHQSCKQLLFTHKMAQYSLPVLVNGRVETANGTSETALVDMLVGGEAAVKAAFAKNRGYPNETHALLARLLEDGSVIDTEGHCEWMSVSTPEDLVWASSYCLHFHTMTGSRIVKES